MCSNVYKWSGYTFDNSECGIKISISLSTNFHKENRRIIWHDGIRRKGNIQNIFFAINLNDHWFLSVLIFDEIYIFQFSMIYEKEGQAYWIMEFEQYNTIEEFILFIDR